MTGGQVSKQGGGGMPNEKTDVTVPDNEGLREGGDPAEGAMMVQGMTLRKEMHAPRDVRKQLSESPNPLFVLYEEFGHLIPELGTNITCRPTNPLFGFSIVHNEPSTHHLSIKNTVFFSSIILK